VAEPTARVEEYGCHLEVRWNRLAADDPVAAGLADQGVWCTSDPPGEGR
jgi:hypothetical protein